MGRAVSVLFLVVFPGAQHRAWHAVGAQHPLLWKPQCQSPAWLSGGRPENHLREPSRAGDEMRQRGAWKLVPMGAAILITFPRTEK